MPGGLTDPETFRFADLPALAAKAAELYARIDGDALRYGRARLYAFAGHPVGLRQAGGVFTATAPDATCDAPVPFARANPADAALGD